MNTNSNDNSVVTTYNRHFYASKPTRNGKEIVPFAFGKKQLRDEWVNKHGDKEAKPISALEAYRMLNCNPNKDIVIANRTHRLVKVNDLTEVDTTKGQHVVIYNDQ